VHRQVLARLDELVLLAIELQPPLLVYQGRESVTCS
jgi:hypothetical protein